MDAKERAATEQNLADELNAVSLYRAFSNIEQDAKVAEVFRRMAETEQRHADTWAAELRDDGLPVLPFRLAWRTRVLIWVARHFGVETVLPNVVRGEERATQAYGARDGASAMEVQERGHAIVLRHLGQLGSGGVEGGTLARLEGRHKALGGNALRAAVLGANDGLVSNLSLVMGVAGANLAAGQIVVTGFAGLLAGACAMALGEWVSVQSAREAFQKQISTERAEIVAHPEEETEELALIYQARGLAADRALDLAHHVMADETRAVETLAREELGVDTHELGGSAWQAATASFLLFAVGAIVPVFPFLLVHGPAAIALSGLASAAGLFVIGAAITLFTGRSIITSGLRMVAFGLGAAVITFAIGRLVGVSVIG
jgi:vacuolar iron transporter family protein